MYIFLDKVAIRLSQHLKQFYKRTRFDVGEDAWPPEQPKDFTPVVLVHYEEQRTMKDVNIITEAVHTGHISDIISAASDHLLTKHHQQDSHRPLREALQSSKVTKEVNKILMCFDQCKDPQTILIEGAPGIGKSVLMKEIAYTWAKEEAMKTIQLLFLVHLRDPKVQKLSSLHEFLELFCNCNISSSEILQCMKSINRNNGQAVVFLFDGYDEFPKALRENSLIADIISRKVLPECGLILSSRPHASQHFRNKSTLRVDILGFTEAEREKFIQQSLKNQPDKILELTKYINEHSTISSLCFIPFNMLVLMLLFKQGYLPKNSNDLYKYFICLTISRHLAKSSSIDLQPLTDLENLPEPFCIIIKQLSKLSLQALNKNQLIFNLEQIKSICPQLETIPGAINGFGLLQVVQHVDIITNTKTFNFIHSSIQEYLAAYHVANLPPFEEQDILQKYFWSDIHFNMFNYYVALTKGQHPQFKLFLRRGNSEVSIDDKFLKDKLQSLRLYRIFHEAGDYHICKTIERKFTDQINLRHTTLSPNNIEDLAVFLTTACNKNWKLLNLNGCHIQDFGVQMLQRYIKRSNVTIDSLWLDNNDLTSSSDSSLSDLISTSKVKRLDISNNKTVGETPQFFAKILSDPSEMETLYMYSNNYSTTKWAEELFLSLKENKTLKNLVVGHNNISDTVFAVVICETLSVNNTLRLLSLRGNKITEQTANLFLCALKGNNTLELLYVPSYCELVTDDITELQQYVRQTRKKQGCDVNFEVL